MSYIFGIIDFERKTAGAEELSALERAVRWDGSVAHTLIDGNVALGYCHHPERNPKAGIFRDEELIVLADIRIYNAGELKQSFDFATPEEAFAKAYRRWGAECAGHINGDFAVVVIDRQKGKVSLFRDHIGARPLAYRFSGNRLIFASHEYGLAKSGLCKAALLEEKLVSLLFRFKEKYEQTVFGGIHKVTPGHCLSFSRGMGTAVKYWKPENISKNKTLSFNDAVEGLRERIITATRNRMEPGKTGLHVSGGLDSCGIAAIVAAYSPDKSLLTGYSWTPEQFDEKVEGTDEREFIDAFSQEKEIRIHYARLEEFESVKDEIDPEFPTQNIEHPVMRLAGKEGIGVLFSGWGGDEFVSLSLRGTVNHLFFTFKWLSLLNYARKRGIKTTICQFRVDVLPLLIPFGLLLPYKGGYQDWSVLRMLKPAFIRRHWKQIFFHSRKNIFGYGNRTRFALNLLDLRHIPDRMDSWSINAERYGFEYKYPLVDKDVLEFWFSLPVEFTYMDFRSRLLYREVMKGILPEIIRTRPDKGEAYRIAFSQRERKTGKKYLAELFYALKPEEHLPFINRKALVKEIKYSPGKNFRKNIRSMNKLILYLRHVALSNEYSKPFSTIINGRTRPERKKNMADAGD